MKETPIIGLPDQTGKDSAASIYTHSHRNHRPLSTMEIDRCVPGNPSCFKDFFFYFCKLAHLFKEMDRLDGLRCVNAVGLFASLRRAVRACRFSVERTFGEGKWQMRCYAGAGCRYFLSD